MCSRMLARLTVIPAPRSAAAPQRAHRTTEVALSQPEIDSAARCTSPQPAACPRSRYLTRARTGCRRRRRPVTTSGTGDLQLGCRAQLGGHEVVPLGIDHDDAKPHQDRRERDQRHRDALARSRRAGDEPRRRALPADRDADQAAPLVHPDRDALVRHPAAVSDLPPRDPPPDEIHWPAPGSCAVCEVASRAEAAVVQIGADQKDPQREAPYACRTVSQTAAREVRRSEAGAPTTRRPSPSASRA